MSSQYSCLDGDIAHSGSPARITSMRAELFWATGNGHGAGGIY